jgi:hydrogenase expression/formation protein HypD
MVDHIVPLRQGGAKMDDKNLQALLDAAPPEWVVTFGDMMRVPGSTSSLEQEKAQGRDIRVVYSTLDALKWAQQHPDKEVVFLGVGFETTAPTIAAPRIFPFFPQIILAIPSVSPSVTARSTSA